MNNQQSKSSNRYQLDFFNTYEVLLQDYRLLTRNDELLRFELDEKRTISLNKRSCLTINYFLSMMSSVIAD